MNAYIRRVMRRTAARLDTEWLVGGTPQNDTLKQLVGGRLMWPVRLRRLGRLGRLGRGRAAVAAATGWRSCCGWCAGILWPPPSVVRQHFVPQLAARPAPDSLPACPPAASTPPPGWTPGCLQLALAQSEPLLPGLCVEYTGTPLWRRVLDAAGGGPGDAGVQAAPGGFADEAPGVPPDLLPATYMIGAALPSACNATLMGEPGLPGGLELAELAPATAAAIQRCYLADPSHAEAVRCLYALPLLAALTQSEDFQRQPGESLAASAASDGASGSLPWLLLTAGNASRGKRAPGPASCLAWRAVCLCPAGHMRQP
jgi:hypothetical protein